MTTRNKYISGHLSTDEMMRYHRHLISKDEIDAIDKHLSSCELCSDAMKGMAEMRDAMNIYNITHDLKKKISKRASSRKKIFSGFDLISIVLILFVIGLIILIAFYFLYLKWN